MLFNSLEFVLFFPVVTLLYFLLPYGWRWLLMLLASAGFYMAGIPEYILILLLVIAVDYGAGILIENASGRKRTFYLAASIVANLAILFFSSTSTLSMTTSVRCGTGWDWTGRLPL